MNVHRVGLGDGGRFLARPQLADLPLVAAAQEDQGRAAGGKTRGEDCCYDDLADVERVRAPHAYVDALLVLLADVLGRADGGRGGGGVAGYRAPGGCACGLDWAGGRVDGGFGAALD